MNEMKQQFETHNMDERMKKAAEDAARISPPEHVRRLQIENIYILVLLGVIGVIACFILGVF